MKANQGYECTFGDVMIVKISISELKLYSNYFIYYKSIKKYVI